jgi:Lon-like protease
VRKLFYLGSLAVIAAAILYVPLPLLVLAPAPLTAATAAVEVGGVEEELNGDLYITTVSVLPTTTSGAFRALLDDHRDVTLQATIVPADVDEEEFFEVQRELFRESVQVAAAVGLELAGHEVNVGGGGARVIEIMPDSPAQGELREGDVIVAADGQEVQLASELAAVTGAAGPGDVLTLTVVRAGEETEVDVRTTIISEETEQVGIGVWVQTEDQEIDLPEDLDLDVQARIGGPSAGLILALTVYDLFSDEDLLGGREVAGTGTVDLTGRVGAVGGVDKKVKSSIDAGAGVFLVPERLEEVARDAAGDDIEVIPVASVEEAIEALRD